MPEDYEPTREELDEYVAKLEAESDAESQEDRDLALQAQIDLEAGRREVQEQQRAKIAALLRAFKGIQTRRDITTLATIGLRRFKRLQDAEIDRQRKEQS